MSDPTTTACIVCGELAGARHTLCPRCGAPVSVPRLDDLTPADLQLYTHHGVGALAACLDELPTAAAGLAVPAELFEAYLSAYWLRPETALILAAEAAAIASLGDRLEAPWLDLGCGDGVHVSLYRGWRFGVEFDVFQGVDPTRRDMFDHFDAAAFTAEVVHSGQAIEHAIDIKPTAIQRAAALGTIGTPARGDATALPLDAGAVACVFSNMIRDLGPLLPAALAEVSRVLRPRGHLVMSTMTPLWHRSLIFHNLAGQGGIEGDRYRRLDRGRSELGKEQRSVEQWSALLNEHGLEMIRQIPLVAPQVVALWDVGLRPFSAEMVRQTQRWRRRGVLADVKPPLMAVLRQLLTPIARCVNSGSAHAMRILVCRRR